MALICYKGLVMLESEYRLMKHSEDEDDGELLREYQMKNDLLEGKIITVEEECDEWKSKVLAMEKIIQDMNDLTIKLTDSLGSQIGEANRILNRFRKTNPFLEDLQTWNEIVEEANEHLSQYKPYQK